MRHFPVFLDTRGKVVIVSGAGACAIAKLRLLLKTEAEIRVFSATADQQVLAWAKEGRVLYQARELEAADLDGALLLYAANDDEILDSQIAALGRAAQVKTLVVDNLEQSDFITPAIVDRDPVTVAIGTEGSAPVLARKIKADIEEALPSSLGHLARAGMKFRHKAEALAPGRQRREFWSRYYFDKGPKAVLSGENALQTSLDDLLADSLSQTPEKGRISFIGAGPGDPELLTLKARKVLHEADVVIHDGLIPHPILELARREAEIISVAKSGFGPSWRQNDINELLIEHGRKHHVVRLKSGDGGIFGRLDEEVDAVSEHCIAFDIVPGITTAAVAAAQMGVSLTKRGRNSSVQFVTGHDVEGYAEQDWRALAQPGAVTAVYMFRSAARFIQGRLMMHGASAQTPVSVLFNVSQPDQRILTGTLNDIADLMEEGAGAALLFIGLAARDQSHPSSVRDVTAIQQSQTAR